MDEDVMHEKITQAVKRYSKANPYSEISTGMQSSVDTEERRNRKDEEEHIVSLKKARFMNMVVCMKVPHQTVHHVFVGKPGHELHEKESGNEYENV